MSNTRKRSDQDLDEYLFIVDTCRDRLNACNPPEGPTNRQYDNGFRKLYRAIKKQSDKPT